MFQKGRHCHCISHAHDNEMEEDDQYEIDKLVHLICNCNLVDGSMDEIRSEVIHCLNVDGDKSKELDQTLLDDTNEAIANALDARRSYTSIANASN